MLTGLGGLGRVCHGGVCQAGMGAQTGERRGVSFQKTQEMQYTGMRLKLCWAMQVRSRAWPVLLGLGQPGFDPEQYAELSRGRHRDSGTVECDVDRSLWAFTEGEPFHKPYRP
jgi:hypothetical protein